MQVNPGELNKKIAFINLTVTQDTDGYPVKTRTTFHTCFAKFSRTSGTELIKSNADFLDTSVKFLIRYTRKAIDRKMLIVYDGDDYEIEYLNDYGDRKEYIEIVATRLTNG